MCSWLALLMMTACTGTSTGEGDDGDLTACQTDLGEAEQSLADARFVLETTEAALALCEVDLAAVEAALAPCETDLAAAEDALTPCTTDLATCEGDLDTCETDLTAASGDLATCEGDLDTCDDGLVATEADVVALLGELDELAPVRGDDLAALIASNERQAWTGRTWSNGFELERQFFFFPDGTAMWGRRDTSGGSGPGYWTAGRWSVQGNKVSLTSGSGGHVLVHAAGRLMLLSDNGAGTLTHQTYDTLAVTYASDAVPTGAWTGCADASPLDTCLADDGSGGTNPMSLEWSHTAGGGYLHVFAEGLSAAGGATNAVFGTSVGNTTVNQSTAGAPWVKLTAPTLSPGTHTVTLDNAGANGVVMGGAIVWIEADWNFWP